MAGRNTKVALVTIGGLFFAGAAYLASVGMGYSAAGAGIIGAIFLGAHEAVD